MATSADRDTDRLTIRYEDGGDGWVTARVVEEPAAISQGRTRHEAYENVLQALHGLHHDATFVERVVEVVEPVLAQTRTVAGRVERVMRDRTSV